MPQRYSKLYSKDVCNIRRARFAWILNKGQSLRASLVVQTVKNLPATRETWVQSLGQEDPLKKEMATHSSILAWRIPWTEEPGGVQSMGSQRVGHDRATCTSLWVLGSLFLGKDFLVPTWDGSPCYKTERNMCERWHFCSLPLRIHTLCSRRWPLRELRRSTRAGNWAVISQCLECSAAGALLWFQPVLLNACKCSKCITSSDVLSVSK